MASEYSVNIKLNTAQVKKDLKTIGDGISNLGKKQAKGSKQALSDTEKRLKAENTSLGLQNRSLGLSLKALPLQMKGVKLEKATALLQQATTKAIAEEFELSKQNLLLADQEIKKAQIRFKAEQTINSELAKRAKLLAGGPTGFTAAQYGPQPAMQGPRFPTGISSALNYDRFTGKLLTGPAGSGGMSFKNLGRRFDMQSALISGGFPLLFGQGPIGAAAGGLGGGVGGMFGQMGGFAGGIAATAAVQSIANTLNSVRELGNALSKPTENLKLLTERLSLTNTPTGDLIAKLEKLGMTSTAASVLIEEFAERTGKTPEEVKAATKELEEFNRGMADLGLKVGFIVSDVLGPAITLLNKLPLEGIAKFFMGRGFGFLNPGGALSPFKESLPQKKLRLEKSRGSGVGNNLPSNLQDLDAMANEARAAREILPLRQALEIEQQRFTVNGKILGATKEKNKLDSKIAELDILKKEAAIQTNDALDFKIEKLTAEIDLQRQIYDNALMLADPIQAQTIQLDQQMAVLLDRGSQIVAVSQLIANSFEESFKGIINGTMSVEDAFRNMLNSIANHFINTAAKMAANQLQSGLLSMFGSLFGGFSITGGATNTGLSTAQQVAKDTALYSKLGSVNTFPAGSFANGGYAQRGKSYLVGEKGPEMFTPGAVGGQVSPMGSTNIVVNVDASGSSVEGDEQSGRELGRLIAVAVQSELIQQKRPGGILA